MFIFFVEKLIYRGLFFIAVSLLTTNAFAATFSQTVTTPPSSTINLTDTYNSWAIFGADGDVDVTGLPDNLDDNIYEKKLNSSIFDSPAIFAPSDCTLGQADGPLDTNFSFTDGTNVSSNTKEESTIFMMLGSSYTPTSICSSYTMPIKLNQSSGLIDVFFMSYYVNFDIEYWLSGVKIDESLNVGGTDSFKIAINVADVTPGENLEIKFTNFIYSNTWANLSITAAGSNFNGLKALSIANGDQSSRLKTEENTLVVSDVVATTGTANNITFSLGGVDASKFNIITSPATIGGAATTTLAFKSAADYEIPNDSGSDNTYDVILSATDSVQTADYLLSVEVTDVDDNVALSNGTPQWQHWVEQDVATQTNAHRSFSADIDGDGDNDIVVGSININILTWYENDGTGNFSSHSLTVPAGASIREIYAADMDKNGGVDILAADAVNDAIYWYKNDGSENFTLVTLTDNAVNLDGATGLYVIDLNNDTFLDIVATGQNNADLIVWYENNQAGDFIQKIIWAPGVNESLYEVHADDLNGDGDIDVIAGFWEDESNDLIWFSNNGGSTFNSTVNVVSNTISQATSITTADLDGDADKDIITVSRGTVEIYWHQNDGAGNFTKILIDTDAAYSSIRVGVNVSDIDNDGDTDIIVAAGTLISYFENDGAANFTKRQVSTSQTTLNSVESADLNGDGSIEIFATNNDTGKIVWLSQQANFSANENQLVAGTVAALDADSDSLTYSISGGVDAAKFSINPTSGVISFVNTPDFEAPDDSGTNGTYDLVVTVTDSLASAVLPVTVTLTNIVNEVPTITGTATVSTINDNQTLSSFANLVLNDGNGDNISVSITYTGANGALSGEGLSGSVGSYTIASDIAANVQTILQGLIFTQTENQVSVGNTVVTSFSLIVNDGAQNSVTHTTTQITATSINDAPLISGTPATTVNEDSVYSFAPVGNDVDSGDILTYSITNKPSWASFNSSTGSLNGTPTNNHVGTTTGIIISVSDATVSASLPAFSLEVINSNDAPIISSTAITAATQDAAYRYTFAATDVNTGDVLSLSAVTKPSWLSFNATSGLLSGTPANADVGSHAVTLRVTDTGGLTAQENFSVSVTNVNDAPIISSTAITAATQDAAYSYTFAATDVDTGDVLSLSAVTIPSWLSFNAATGVLSGTPTNADVGSNAVTLRVTDTAGLTAEQNFSVSVTNVNDVPVATSAIVTLEEDSSIMITLAAEDADSDPLTYEVVTNPASGTLEQHGSVWLYTPEKDFNGPDLISFVAKDAELSSEPATVTINVTSVNDEPQAVEDSYTLTRAADDIYTLAVLTNDVDVDGDTLTIDGAAADIGSIQIGSEGLIFTALDAYVGPVALRYTISDGHKGRATANVNVLIEGVESENQPVITLPDDVDVNATGLFTRVKLGFAKAVDRNGQPLPVSLVNENQFFAPGSYLVYWQAVDSDGNIAIKAQKVKVHPLISFSKDQAVGEGNEVVISVHLNGVAPEYPLSIPYTVTGSADSSDHDLVDGVVEVTSGQMAQIRFSTLEDGEVEGDEDLLISLDANLNLGSKQQTQVLITETNIAPTVSLDATQAGEHQLIVAQNGGDVRINAEVTDANLQDNLTLAWESGSLTLQSDDTGMFFSPTEVLPGIYPVNLTVTDDGLPTLSTTEQVYIVVRQALPALTGADTDGDLIPDIQEGFTDSDRDGIPDYLDVNSDCNVIPEDGLQAVSFLAEGQAGVCLRLGSIALRHERIGVLLLPDSIPEDSIAANVGGIFDFTVTGLPKQGQSYSLVLPQRLPIPANAIYRKYQENGWKDFVIDDRNSVASSEGERGFCPPPGDSRWTPGLIAGHWCVQLTIEDGGPNDDDGVANRTIVDPSGVSVILNGNRLPVANPDAVSLSWNQSLDVDVLANDTDSDSDTLSVTQVISEFGTVVILENQQLSYTSAADFIGTDVVVYSITDGQGGTASSELTVVVIGNTAPIAVDDSAATDDRTSLLLDVLSNDSDTDGNTLTLVSATSQQGTVSVESNKLRYIPKTGFDGVDTVSYRISDGLGGEVTGLVLITVKAYQEVMIDNQSGGGSMSLWALALLLACGLMRRRELQRLTMAALLLVSATGLANASDWYLEGFVGQAQADNGMSNLQPQVGAGVVTAFDDTDTAFGVSVGYQWTPVVAVELGYTDFGNGSARIEGSSLTPEQYHEQVKAVTPVLADGIMLGLRFTLLQHDGWRFEVPVGLFSWQADISSTMGNTHLTTELDGTDWYAGIRLSYQFSDFWSIGLGYQYVDLEPNYILSSQLNLRYQF